MAPSGYRSITFGFPMTEEDYTGKSSDFPLFRKYPNGKAYFKVHSPELFEELQLIGKRYSQTRIQATTLLERNYIRDLVDQKNGQWETISEAEYEEMLDYCQENLTEL